MLLAEGLSRLPAVDAAGRAPIAIKVATATPGRDFDDLRLPFEVVREPGLLSLVKLVYEADVRPSLGGLLRPAFPGVHSWQADCYRAPRLYRFMPQWLALL